MIADPHKLGNPDAFDALADLFLGQMNAVHAHEAAVGAVPRTRGNGGSTAWHETAKEGGNGLPKLALADERPVSDAEYPRKSGNGGGEPPQVEVIVLGHLPVMASAWAGQYARHVAERVQKPVAMVRLGGEDVRIEMHAPAGGNGSSVRAAAGLAAAVEAVRREAARVILMTDSGREAELAETPGVNRVTLLTSGDEAGIVAAYGLIKTLAQRLKAAHGPGAEATLRVAVMGAPPARAEFVVERLQDAARAFLGIELQADACIARIGPGTAGAEVFAGVMGGPARELVKMLGDGGMRQESKETELEIEEEAVAEDEAVTPSAESGSSEAANDSPAGSRRDAGSLAGFVPGLMTMAARCPHAEEVELAVDEDGALHVLARAEAYGLKARTVERLMAAAAWAETNRRVLQLTLGDNGRSIASRAVLMHVFTDQPALWRGLLESPLRVHMLAAVTKHDREWACAPVN